MIIPILKNANSTTPSDPLLLAGSPSSGRLYVTTSWDYAVSGAMKVVLDQAKDPSGPWEQLNENPVDFGGGPATNRLISYPFSAGTVIWLRARLSAVPSAGDISVDLLALC